MSVLRIVTPMPPMMKPLFSRKPLRCGITFFSRRLLLLWHNLLRSCTASSFRSPLYCLARSYHEPSTTLRLPAEEQAVSSPSCTLHPSEECELKSTASSAESFEMSPKGENQSTHSSPSSSPLRSSSSSSPISNVERMEVDLRSGPQLTFGNVRRKTRGVPRKPCRNSSSTNKNSSHPRVGESKRKPSHRRQRSRPAYEEQNTSSGRNADWSSVSTETLGRKNTLNSSRTTFTSSVPSYSGTPKEHPPRNSFPSPLSSTLPSSRLSIPETEGGGWCLEPDIDPITGESPMEILYSHEQLRYHKLLVCETGELPKEAYADGSISPHFFVGFSHYDYRLRDVYRAVIAKQLSSLKDMEEPNTSSSSSVLGVQHVQLSVSWSGRFNPKLFHRVQRVCGVRLLLPSSSSPATSPTTSTASSSSDSEHHTDKSLQGNGDGLEDAVGAEHTHSGQKVGPSPHHHGKDGRTAAADHSPHEMGEGSPGMDGMAGESKKGPRWCSSTGTTSSSSFSSYSLPTCWQRRVRAFVQRINHHVDSELLSLRFFQAAEPISEVDFELSSLGANGSLSPNEEEKKQKNERLHRTLIFLLRDAIQRLFLRAHVCVMVLGNGEAWRRVWEEDPHELARHFLLHVKKTPECTSVGAEEDTFMPPTEQRKGKGTGLEKDSQELLGQRPLVEEEKNVMMSAISVLHADSRSIRQQKHQFLYQNGSWLKLFYTRQIIPRVVSLPALAVLVAVEILRQRSEDVSKKQESHEKEHHSFHSMDHCAEKKDHARKGGASHVTFGSFFASIFPMLEAPLQGFVEDLAAQAAAVLPITEGRQQGLSEKQEETTSTTTTEEVPTEKKEKIQSKEEEKTSYPATEGKDSMEESSEADDEDVEDEELLFRCLFMKVMKQNVQTPCRAKKDLGSIPPSTVDALFPLYSRSSAPQPSSSSSESVSTHSESSERVAAAFTWLQFVHLALQQCVGTSCLYGASMSLTRGRMETTQSTRRAVGEESSSKSVALPFPFFFLHGAYGGTISEMEYLKRNKIAADAAILHPSHTSIKNLLRSRQEKNRRRTLALGIPASRKREDFFRDHRRPALFEEMHSMDHHRSS